MNIPICGRHFSTRLESKSARIISASGISSRSGNGNTSNINAGKIADASKMANDNKIAGPATIVSVPNAAKEEAASS